MWIFVAKTAVAGLLIAFSSWLAGKRPELAGFIIALPLTTLLALAFAQVEHQDPENSVRFAQSVFTAIPISLLFFMPFLAATKLQWPFWGLYASGLALLVCGYFVHKWAMAHLFA